MSFLQRNCLSNENSTELIAVPQVLIRRKLAFTEAVGLQPHRLDHLICQAQVTDTVMDRFSIAQ